MEHCSKCHNPILPGATKCPRCDTPYCKKNEILLTFNIISTIPNNTFDLGQYANQPSRQNSVCVYESMNGDAISISGGSIEVSFANNLPCYHQTPEEIHVNFTSKWTPRKVNVRISDNDMTGFVGQELIIKLQESRALTDNQYLQSAVCIKGTQTSIKMEPDTDAINVQIRINPTGEYRFVKTYRYAGLFKTRVIEDKPRKIPVYQYELLVK